MKDKPLVSILINNYNYGRFIHKAIDSALNQTYPHTEVVVVDDGSTDNSCEIIASYKDQIIPVLKENGGQASAFNVGFATSKGDIICFLDSDDIFVPEKVAEIVKIFESYQNIGWCFHRGRLIDVNTGALLRLEPECVGLDPKGESLSQECDFRSQIRRGKLRFFSPATSNLCFRRSLLQQILPMPESEGSTAADRHMKFLAIALSQGFFLDEQLTSQQIHGSNAYNVYTDNTYTELDKSKQRFAAREITVVAYWIRTESLELAKFTNKLFAKGLGVYWRTGGVETKYKELIKNYLSAVSPVERLEIHLRALYHYLNLKALYQYLRKCF